MSIFRNGHLVCPIEFKSQEPQLCSMYMLSVDLEEANKGDPGLPGEVYDGEIGYLDIELVSSVQTSYPDYVTGVEGRVVCAYAISTVHLVRSSGGLGQVLVSFPGLWHCPEGNKRRHYVRKGVLSH